jgi:uncharacterized lipoprotein NlpE involved in copper resistance
MKRSLIALLLAITALAACNNNASDDKEKQDSLAAEQAADSMLNAATASDTAEADGTLIDTTGTDSLKLQKK